MSNLSSLASETTAPLRISLQTTRQQFNQFRPDLGQATSKTVIALHDPARCHQCSGRSLRPNRAEPRVTKRRPRVFPGYSNLAQSSKLN